MSRIGVLLGRACSPGSLPSTLTSINSDVDTLRNPFSLLKLLTLIIKVNPFE